MILWAVTITSNMNYDECVLFDDLKTAGQFICDECNSYIIDEEDVDMENTFVLEREDIDDIRAGQSFNVKFKNGEEIRWSFVSPRFYGGRRYE